MARQQYPPGQEPWRDFTLWLQREMQNSGKAQRQLADVRQAGEILAETSEHFSIMADLESMPLSL